MEAKRHTSHTSNKQKQTARQGETSDKDKKYKTKKTRIPLCNRHWIHGGAAVIYITLNYHLTPITTYTIIILHTVVIKITKKMNNKTTREILEEKM